jgi:hypothetical protein
MGKGTEQKKSERVNGRKLASEPTVWDGDTDYGIDGLNAPFLFYATVWDGDTLVSCL